MSLPPITLIGHPYAPIGMGEQLRCHLAALRAVAIEPRVLDIFRFSSRSDPAHLELVRNAEVTIPPAGLRIFHLNGDEVDNARDAFRRQGIAWDDSVNIICPAWELPDYPAVWAEKLRDFHEIWAMSRFVQASLRHAGLASHVIPPSVQPAPGLLLPRRHFGIRESAFVLLHFFDLTSYASRKNPEAVLRLFAALHEADRFADVQLVLKVKHGESDAAGWARSFLGRHAGTGQILLLDQALDSLGVRSLIAACDCFVSLHRAEGFGRGLAEAMALGRLALGTDWSGNTDFLTVQTGVPVDYRLIPVAEGDYPHAAGQVWADPIVEDALQRLLPLIRAPEQARSLARAGQQSILLSHSHRSCGLAILSRLTSLAALYE